MGDGAPSRPPAMLRLTRFSIDRPTTAICGIGIITVLLSLGIPRTPVSYGHRALIGDAHPVVVAIDSLVDRFGGGYPIEVAWECGPGKPCAHALDRDSLRVAHDLTEKLRRVAGVRNVTSPSNASILSPSPDGFEVRRLVEDGKVVSDREVLASRAAEDDLWRGRIVSADGSTAVIVIQPTSGESVSSARLVDIIDEALAPHRATGFDFKMNGLAARDVITGRALKESTQRIIPALVLVISITLYALNRSFSHVVIALATMGVALLWTMGLMGWMGWPEDEIHQILAPLILIVGVCDAVHLLSRACAATGTPRRRMLSAVEDVGPPCVMTTTTTAVALGSFVTSGLESFVRLGTITAVGVSFCLLLTFSLLPILVTYCPGVTFPPPSNLARWDSMLARATRLIEARWRGILFCGAAVVVLGVFGWAAYLRVDTDWRTAWGDDSPVTQWLGFFEEKLGASASLEVQLEVPAGDSVDMPEVLSVLGSLARDLSSLDGLGRPSSVIDLLGRLNQILHQGNPDFDRPAKTRGGNAELLELIGFDDPDSLAPWVSLDRRSMRLSVQADLVSHNQSSALMEDVRGVVASTVPGSWDVVLTGVVATNERWEAEVVSTQMRSFPTAFALVFILVSAFMRSVRLGLAAMLPTLVPIFVVLGGMGWLDMGLDLGRAMIAAVMIGIGVDDSIHFLRDYEANRRRGVGRAGATHAALRSTGRALVSTSIALALGFLTLSSSAWQTIASFGVFVSLTIVAALVSTVLFLPALLFSPLGQRS